jgi:hypothetical protein
MHSNRLIKLQKREQCTFCMQLNKQEDEKEKESVTWNKKGSGS